MKLVHLVNSFSVYSRVSFLFMSPNHNVSRTYASLNVCSSNSFRFLCRREKFFYLLLIYEGIKVNCFELLLKTVKNFFTYNDASLTHVSNCSTSYLDYFQATPGPIIVSSLRNNFRRIRNHLFQSKSSTLTFYLFNNV